MPNKRVPAIMLLCVALGACSSSGTPRSTRTGPGNPPGTTHFMTPRLDETTCGKFHIAMLHYHPNTPDNMRDTSAIQQAVAILRTAGNNQALIDQLEQFRSSVARDAESMSVFNDAGAVASLGYGQCTNP